MKGVAWGLLYNEFGTKYPNVEQTEAEVKRLMMDEDVTSKKGIYEYILSGREKVLSIRRSLIIRSVKHTNGKIIDVHIVKLKV